jgi:hypothetical protein
MQRARFASYILCMGRTEKELLAKREELMSRDVDQIAAIKGNGIDIRKERQLELTFWAPNAAAAKSFADACKRNEMPPYIELGPSPSEANQRWLIRCSITASVRFMTEKENVATFLLFADKFDCEYDGWGTAIVEVAGLKTPAQ